MLEGKVYNCEKKLAKDFIKQGAAVEVKGDCKVCETFIIEDEEAEPAEEKKTEPESVVTGESEEPVQAEEVTGEATN